MKAREAMHAVLVARRGSCWHVHPETLLRLPEGEWECADLVARLTTDGFTITTADVAEAGEAVLSVFPGATPALVKAAGRER
jgi:hypothetical protein